MREMRGSIKGKGGKSSKPVPPFHFLVSFQYLLTHSATLVYCYSKALKQFGPIGDGRAWISGSRCIAARPCSRNL